MPSQIAERDPSGDEVLVPNLGLFDVGDVAPYIDIDSLAATIPHLLGIEEQLKRKFTDLGPVILFPRRIQSLNWAQLRCLHLGENGEWFHGVSGQWVGIDRATSVDTILTELGCVGGITSADRRKIRSALRRRQRVQKLYT